MQLTILLLAIFHAAVQSLPFEIRSQKIMLPFVQKSSSGYNSTYPLTQPVTLADGSVEFRIAIISDQDTQSKHGVVHGTWVSYLKQGKFTIKKGWTSASLTWDASIASNDALADDEVPGGVVGKPPGKIHSEAGQAITSSFAFGNRGMELSTIIVFNGKLYACEDRTGIIFQIVDNMAVPWVILADGDGMRQKGFKCEWSIVKDEHLIIGSHSADIKTPNVDGPSVKAPQRWIKRISKDGLVEHLDWNAHYAALEQHLGISPPGYIMVETVMWSELRKSWYILPRHINPNNYTDERHPYTCSNIMVTASEDFTHMSNMTIGEHNPLYGFSATRMVPGTDDTVIIGLRVMEVEETFSTRIVVFTVTGTVLLVEEEVLDGLKYEGIEFV